MFGRRVDMKKTRRYKSHDFKQLRRLEILPRAGCRFFL
jgi:hypothetical protein